MVDVKHVLVIPFLIKHVISVYHVERSFLLMTTLHVSTNNALSTKSDYKMGHVQYVSVILFQTLHVLHVWDVESRVHQITFNVDSVQQTK